MTSSIDLKLLASPDIGEANALLDLFGEAFGEPEIYRDGRPAADHLARILASPTTLVLVASSGGLVVGGLVAYELQKIERTRSEFYIYDLAVAESHRRLGIATALIRRLGEIAAERGAWVMFVQADLVDAPAVALYTKLGNREDVLHFDIAPARRDERSATVE
jgi:aminoglycoside 3-N-acetyltransferase I